MRSICHCFLISLAVVHTTSIIGLLLEDAKAVIVMFLMLLIAQTTRYQRWGANLGWCRSPTNDLLYEGDFNGDGRMDLLCHRTTNGYKWIAYANANGQFTGTSWERGIGWCHHADGELHVGDFDGDGKDDLLCHDTNNGYKWVALANSAGNFEGHTTWDRALGWCWHASGELHIGDFNGDGRDDMLCHDTNDGHLWISFARPGGNFAGGTSWDYEMGWCYHTGGELHIGDFNGKDDLLCHSTNNGNKFIAYANNDGNFREGTGWQESIAWCYHSAAELHIGDVNGDGKDDLICHDTCYKSVAYANCQGNFHDRTSWEAPLGWCLHATGQFFVGDYNGDSRTDMLCHDTSSGYKWAIYEGLCQPFE